MRKVLIISLVFALLLAAGFGCVRKYASPERTLETFVNAQKAGNVDAYLDCLTKESREWFEAMVKMTPEGLTSESLKAQEVQYDPAKLKVTEKTRDTAVMKAEGEPLGLKFKKERDGWKIDLLATMQEMFKGMQPGW